MAPGRYGKAAALVIAVCGLWPSAALAAPGDLDPSFGGGDGKVTTDLGGEDNVSDVALQPDGKLLVAGTNHDENEFALARYLPDGALDTTFGGGDGIVTSNLLTYGQLAPLPGSAIMVGSGDGDFTLARYTAAGVLDAGFGGGDGIVQTDFGGEDNAYALVRQSDGKLLLGGGGGTPEQFALTRYHPDGSLDMSFGGGDGKATTSFGGEDFLVALAVGSDGKIAAAGGTSAGGTPGNEYDFAVARYAADGALDSGFSGDGRATLGFDGFDHASDVAVLADGGVLVAGTGVFGGKMHATLARYTATGALDPAFGGGDGVTASDLGTFGSDASGLAVQADGRIVIAGSGGAASDDFLLARYTASGGLDPTFGGGDGTVLVDFKGDLDWASDLALQPDGRIVAAGAARSLGAFDDDFAVARFLNDGAPPPEEEPKQPPEESSDQPPSQSGPLALPPPAVVPPPNRAALAFASRIAPVKGSKAFVRLRCRGQVACRGVAKLLARVRVRRGARRSAIKNILLGRTRFRVPVGAAKLLRVPLNRKGRQLLRRAGRRGLRARVVGRGLRNRPVRLRPVQARTRR